MTEQEYEFQVEIDSINYGMHVLSSVHIKQPLFDKIDVGLACCAEMTVEYYIDDANINPTSGAKLVPQRRPRGSQESWEQLGVFWIDMRTTRSGKRTLVCYDSMLKADAPLFDDGDFVGEWPRPMNQVADNIAERMGVTLDPRTVLSSNYLVDFPGELHMRKILQYIAAAHAGNWIMTSKDQLLLVPLATSMPPETWYLVTEYGEPIVFGEDRILV